MYLIKGNISRDTLRKITITVNVWKWVKKYEFETFWYFDFFDMLCTLMKTTWWIIFHAKKSLAIFNEKKIFIKILMIQFVCVCLLLLLWSLEIYKILKLIELFIILLFYSVLWVSSEQSFSCTFKRLFFGCLLIAIVSTFMPYELLC